MDDIKHYQFFRQLEDLSFVQSIILYGSRSQGDNAPRADIDLAINCPKANDNDWSTILDIVENADTLLKIDCVRFDRLSDSNPLKINISKQGVTIYDRND